MGAPEGISKWLGPGGEEKAYGLFDAHAELVGGDQLYLMAPDLAEHMDPFDQAACEAAGDTPRHMLERLLVLSTNKYAVVSRGHVAAMMGTIVRIRDRELAERDLKTPAAQFWLLCSTHASVAPVRTRRLVRHVTRELCKHYGSLYGYIDAKHERMLRVAEWIGGELEPAAPFGEVGALFCKFTIRE